MPRYKNKIKRLTRKLRRRRRRLVTGKAVKNPPCYRKGLQTMGTGSTVAYFESIYNVNAYDSVIQLQTLFNQTEFKTKALEWTYFKIDSISLNVPPVSSNHEMYFLMLWSNDDDSRNNVMYSDSTKKITMHTVRMQHLVWKPPNATLPTGNTLGMPTTNLRNWNVIDDLATTSEGVNTYFIPGRLAIYFPDASGGTGDQIYITAKVRFRGSKYPSVPGILKTLLSRNDLDEENKGLVREIQQGMELRKKKWKTVELLPVERKLLEEIEEDEYEKAAEENFIDDNQEEN